MAAMRLEVHTRGSIYKPQMASMVYLRQFTSDYRRAIANPALYLLGNPSVDPAPTAENDPVLDAAEVAKLRSVLMMMREKGRTAAEINATLRAFAPELPPDAVTYLEGEAARVDTSDFEAVFAGDQDTLLSVALDRVEARQALRLQGARRYSKHGQDADALAALQSIGIRDVVYVEQFPMLTLCAGYKRAPGKVKDHDATMRAFPRVGQARDKFPLYVEPFTTEALLFEVDESRLAAQAEHWSGAPLGGGKAPTDFVAAAKAALVRSQIRELLEAQAGSHDTPGLAAWTLLHTLSHAAIKACAGPSGFNVTSLSEYVLPGALRFAVTINRAGDGGIGGFHSLFEDAFAAVAAGMVDQTRECVHDPSCSEQGRGAACHACLTISETSCRHWNAFLDRGILHGTRKGATYRGFFSGVST